MELALFEGLSDRRGIARAVEGVDVLVHLAARVHRFTSKGSSAFPPYYRDNVEGTEILLEEAARASVRRFIFGSSVKALAEASDRPLDPYVQPEPSTPYGISKLMAERGVAAARNEVETVSLRFPLVYGPGMKGNMLMLFRLVDTGLPLPFRITDNARSVLYIENLAAAVQAVVDANTISDNVYHVCDDVSPSTAALIEQIGRALDRQARWIPMPTRLLRYAARMADPVAQLAGVRRASKTLSPLLESLVLDRGSLERDFGYSAPYSLQAGLRSTAKWYRGTPSRTPTDP